MAMAVFVLESFAIERCTTCSSSQQETSSLHITRRPRQITNALETKHRIVDIKRDHDAVVRRVRRRSCDPGTKSTRFVNTLL